MLDLKEFFSHLTNERAMRARFPQGLPLAGELNLVSQTYGPGNSATFHIFHRGIPTHAPKKWIERGGVGISLKFELGVSHLSMLVAREFDVWPNVRLDLAAESFSLTSGLDPDDMKIFVRTHYQVLEVDACYSEELRLP